MKRNHEIEASCRICEHATLLEGGEHCLCKKRGLVFSYGSCRRFRADLLKYQPSIRNAAQPPSIGFVTRDPAPNTDNRF